MDISKEYTILKSLGKGGEGIVLKVSLNNGPHKGEIRALKVYYKNVTKENTLNFYARMKELLEYIYHPKNKIPKNLLKWYRIFIGRYKNQERYILEMEYVEGSNMENLVKFIEESKTGNLIATPQFIEKVFVGFLEVFRWLNNIDYQLFDTKPDNVIGTNGRFMFIDPSFIPLSYDLESEDDLDLEDDYIGLYGLASLVFAFIFGEKAITRLALQSYKKGNKNEY